MLHVKLTKSSVHVISWLYNGDNWGPSGLRIQSLVEAEHVKTIIEALVVGCMDKEGNAQEGTFSLEMPALIFLKDSLVQIFKPKSGVPSGKSIGIFELVRAIGKAEEGLVKEDAKNRLKE